VNGKARKTNGLPGPSVPAASLVNDGMFIYGSNGPTSLALWKSGTCPICSCSVDVDISSTAVDTRSYRQFRLPLELYSKIALEESRCPLVSVSREPHHHRPRSRPDREEAADDGPR
jgi:hypothetical protein